MQRIVGAVVPLLAAVAAFLCAAIILLFLGASPWEGFKALVDGAFGDVNSLSQTAVRATPLLLVGAGISISFRASVINIGGEGPDRGRRTALDDRRAEPSRRPPAAPDSAGDAGRRGRRRHLGRSPGRAEGLRVGQRDPEHDHAQHRRRAVPELHAARPADRPEGDRSGHADSPDRTPLRQRRPADADRRHPPPPRCADRHRSRPDRLRRAVADAAGIPPSRCRPQPRRGPSGRHPGRAQHRRRPGDERRHVSGSPGRSSSSAARVSASITDGTSAGFTGSAGFNGIVAALFGGLHPLWTIPSSFLFGGLLTGATNLQRALQMPAATGRRPQRHRGDLRREQRTGQSADQRDGRRPEGFGNTTGASGPAPSEPEAATT